jgi:hypothetical protein
MPNVIAFIKSGGVCPDAAESSASSDHSRIALKPMSVARSPAAFAVDEDAGFFVFLALD